MNPKFRRNKDELYLSMNNGELIRLSSNKGEFYAAFGKNASVVKDYMKQQNLKHKKSRGCSEGGRIPKQAIRNKFP